MRSFTLSLAFIMRLKATRKWPIQTFYCEIYLKQVEPPCSQSSTRRLRLNHQLTRERGTKRRKILSMMLKTETWLSSGDNFEFISTLATSYSVNPLHVTTNISKNKFV